MQTIYNLPLYQKIALAAALFLITGTFGFIQPFVPLYYASAGLNKWQIGLIAGLGSAGAAFLQPPLGRLAETWDSRRRVMFLAALIVGTSFLCFQLVRLWWAFLPLTILAWMGWQYLNGVGAVLVGRLGGTGATYASYRVWGSIGYLIVCLLTGLVLPPSPKMPRGDLNLLFTYGPLLFFALFLPILLLPDPKRSPTASMHETLSPESAQGLKYFLLAYFPYHVALYGASANLSLYMKSLHALPVQITGMFALGVICEILLMRFVGRWSDKKGRKPALMFAFILMPIRLLLYIFATNPMGVIAVQALHGLNFGIVGTVAVTYVNDLADLSPSGGRSMAQARLALTMSLGNALGPILCGAIVERLGFGVMFASMAGIGTLSIFLLWFLVKETITQKKEIEK
jgi:MFS transporter, PPP family, 3-phenylpropionic acid transporter